MEETEYTSEEIRKLVATLSDLLDSSLEDDENYRYSEMLMYYETTLDYGIMLGHDVVWSSENDIYINPLIELQSLLSSKLTITNNLRKIIKVIIDGDSLESFLGRPPKPQE